MNNLGLLVVVILMIMRYKHNKRMEELNQVKRNEFVR